MAIILAIESSCDDTGASIINDGVVLSNVITTQLDHSKYGGVIPELASRAHMDAILPVVEAAIDKAGISMQQIEAVAFTQAPGLIGSLMVGACFAKSFAQARSLPLIAVHHMQAHVMAHLIEDPKPSFPFLCLTVSGGHTQLVLCDSPLEMRVIGETIDDAAGEAFDKTAKMLGLKYPGGPIIDALAAKGNPQAFVFPKSNMPAYNFSFSGLKTNILYFIQKQQKLNPAFVEENLNDICASVQYTIIESLLMKLKKAATDYKVKQIGIAGGVSANKGLRSAFESLGKQLNWETYIPSFEYCTDNAAMIAIVAHYKYEVKDFVNYNVVPSPRATW